jgi:hypothetical protein
MGGDSGGNAPQCESCKGTGFSGDSAVPNGGCWDCRGTGLYNGGESATGTPEHLRAVADELERRDRSGREYIESWERGIEP